MNKILFSADPDINYVFHMLSVAKSCKKTCWTRTARSYKIYSYEGFSDSGGARGSLRTGVSNMRAGIIPCARTAAA